MKHKESILCACGCGEPIVWKPHHRYHLPRFLPNHSSRVRINGRGRPPLRPPDDVLPLLAGICGCGCGRPTAVSTNSRPKFHEYFGYPQRFIHGHGAKLLRAERTSKWNGGRRYEKQGYVLVYMPDSPLANPQGYVREHRYVMSQLLGRPLRDDEHVHHRNGNRADNRPDNLELLLIKAHFIGQRAEDIVAHARRIIAEYGHLYPEPT